MRLIDADELIKKYTMATKSYQGGIMERPVILLESVKNAPTIDAVEVVRCKNCKEYEAYKDFDGHGFCKWYNRDNMHEEDFCSVSTYWL